jgi:hypothetical protein
MNSRRVLLLGGRGYFGRLLIEDLRQNTSCDLVVPNADLRDPASLERALDGVHVAICAAGPYQTLPTTLAELCIQRGIHYVDLADDRKFVQKVRSMAAGDSGCHSAVCTGWSTVSALSGLLTKLAAAGMTPIDSIHIHMAPGNRGARQKATIASLMHSVGSRFIVFRDGNLRSVTGWSEPRDFFFPSPVGRRRGYLVDVPDHEIFPKLFAARTVEFRAGSELRLLNHCLSLVRWTGRSRVEWAGLLQRAAALFSGIGHDWGAIGVEVSGSVTRRACIVADSRAERIAVMPAAVMTAELLSGVQHDGVISYTEWLSKEQLQRECAKRSFRLVLEGS